MRLSNFLVPLQKVAKAANPDTLELLVIHGYIKQSSSGVYNMLPLGQRVQQRVEHIVRKHLDLAGCTEMSLATLAETSIWKKSGRLNDAEELFFVRDREDQTEYTSRYLLAPTNEEEVTNMVANMVSSYRQLPLKFYQISKKFRNEKRPRGGLLRAREFVMKDLYTFDDSPAKALRSYKQISNAYDGIFKELGVPFAVAEADSGSIGGSLSHEYHYLSDAGEDTVVNCSSCSYTANIERASYSASAAADPSEVINVDYFLSEDQETLIAAYYPESRTINPLAMKNEMALCEHDIDPLKVFQNNSSINKRLLRLIDPYVSENANLPEPDESLGVSKRNTTTLNSVVTTVEPGDHCPECEGPDLKFTRAIEVGHTFYLGKKYSAPFGAKVQTKDGQSSALEMGCYGIGISRLVSAIAAVTKDEHGLAWPASVSPFDALVIANSEEVGLEITELLDKAGIESVFDDRSNQFGFLLGNSKAMGFPFTVIAGKKFLETGEIEIQSRKSGQSVLASREELQDVFLGLREGCN